MDHIDLKSLVVSDQMTIRDALVSFERSALRVVLICDPARRLLGMVTEGDVRRALLDGHGLITPLITIANKAPVVGTTSMSREELVDLISERIYFLPVLDKDRVLAEVLSFTKRASIPVASPSIGERELRYVTDAVLSGWISSRGKYIPKFEAEFAAFCGTKHGIAVSNGTAALHLSLAALGIGPGDEVIVPALTFAATAAVVRHCNARPVFVDIEETTWNLNINQIENAITPCTKAIVPVHLYGMPCEMDQIIDIANAHNLWVVEDAAEAHGAEFKGKRTGSWGHCGCFSFYGNKLITTGEGGMIVTDSDTLNTELRVLRDHGMSPNKSYWHETIGYNYRMTNIQAAIGLAQLERWQEIIRAKDRVSKWYNDHIPHSYLIRPIPRSQTRAVCWLYTVLLKECQSTVDRDTAICLLKEAGIDCRPIFWPVPSMPPYFENNWLESYPVSHFVSKNGFSLPSSMELTSNDLRHVTDNLGRVLIKSGTKA